MLFFINFNYVLNYKIIVFKIKTQGLKTLFLVLNSKKMGQKQLIMTVDGKEEEPPSGLVVTGDFTRLGIINPAVILCDGRYTIFGRLIYTDYYGKNSAILGYEAVKNDEGLIKIVEGSERTVFPPEAPHGMKGSEDFRLCTIDGEDPIHGFLVNHNGFDARTKYMRTNEINSDVVSDWQQFGVWFPNIRTKEAIELVQDARYKYRWDLAHGSKAVEAAKKLGKWAPDDPFLGTKDCSLWPRKVKVDGQEHYGVITRLLPDMQIVYVRDFCDLSIEEFWQDTVRNLDDSLMLRAGRYDWDASHIGLAGQPVEIDEGTLIFYHGVVMEPNRRYVLGVALADSDNPQKIIAIAPKPIMEPDQPWEREQGVISHDGVLFPTAHILTEDSITGERIVEHFYGASDRSIAYFPMALDYILNRLEPV